MRYVSPWKGQFFHFMEASLWFLILLNSSANSEQSFAIKIFAQILGSLGCLWLVVTYYYIRFDDIMTGPLRTEHAYAFVQHPIYLGYSLIILAITPLLAAPYYIEAPFGVLLALVCWCKIEEKFFEKSLSANELSKYQEYKKSTPFLIPRLSHLGSLLRFVAHTLSHAIKFRS